MTQPPENMPNTAGAPSPSRRHAISWFTFVIALVGISWLCYWYFYLQYHQSTDDAYANGNIMPINAAIEGTVTAFFAEDTDFAVEGQLLVLLDATPYRISYSKELATLASVVLRVRGLYDEVSVNRAGVESKRTALAKASFDYDNRLQLIEAQAVSYEEFVHSKDALSIAQLEFEQAKHQLQVSLDARGKTPLEAHPLIEQQKAAVRAAFYKLHSCAIYAPMSGHIAKRAVEVGQSIVRTTPLMALIPLDTFWVDANFKETQLKDIRIGQPATVWFDLYGSEVAFDGKVLGIASGTGSAFSLIPPQNATGNWIKIVQRLPVRISIDKEKMKKHPLRVGISAQVDIDVTDRTLPFLTKEARTEAAAVTPIFNIDFDAVDKIMAAIIETNLSDSTQSIKQ